MEGFKDMSRYRFLKKITLGTPSSSAEGGRNEVWGVKTGFCPLTRKKIRFWILNGRILVQTVHLKLV